MGIVSKHLLVIIFIGSKWGVDYLQLFIHAGWIIPQEYFQLVSHSNIHVLFGCEHKQVSRGLHFACRAKSHLILNREMSQNNRVALHFYHPVFVRLLPHYIKPPAWPLSSSTPGEIGFYIVVYGKISHYLQLYIVWLLNESMCMCPVCTSSCYHPQIGKWPIHSAICQKAKSRFRPKMAPQPKGSAAGRKTLARDPNHSLLFFWQTLHIDIIYDPFLKSTASLPVCGDPLTWGPSFPTVRHPWTWSLRLRGDIVT